MRGVFMNKIDIIGMPIKYGCFVDGADLAYDALSSSIDTIFKNKGMYKIDNALSEIEEGNKIKYIKPVMELSNRLYKKVYESHELNNFPIIIGGDHSTAIGSISASLDYYKGDVSVIWIDAHSDIHNDKTTPSGNIHGMPLSICIGRCGDSFKIGDYKLDPKNIYYIGLRSYEKEEMDYIKDQKITYYTDSFIKEIGIDNVLYEIIKNIKTKYVHISFDLDSLSDEEFHAVNVSVDGVYQDNGGFNLDEVNKCLVRLLSSLNVCSMDIVEYNPNLDYNKECLRKVEAILEKIDKCLE